MHYQFSFSSPRADSIVIVSLVCFNCALCLYTCMWRRLGSSAFVVSHGDDETRQVFESLLKELSK